MEMLQLRYFYESAMSESFSKTAQKHSVPLSSVSASIKRLENELKTPLFERSGNRVFLNEKGKQFLRTVANVLRELDSGVSTLSTDYADEQKLSILVRITRKNVVARIVKFWESYPLIPFKLDLGHGEKPITDYDIVISAPDERLEEYDHFELWRYFLRVEALADDTLCQRKLTLADLRDSPFVAASTQGQTVKTFINACQRNGFTPKILMECNDYECYNLCLLSGVALGITQGNNNSSALPNVQYLNISDLNEVLVTNLYYKSEKYHGAVKMFVDFMKSFG